jgi:hypothetical protein
VSSTTWIKWYPSDWRADPCLRQCSISARGLWIELLGFMHQAEPYGFLLINGKVPTNAELGRLVGCHHHTITALLTELATHGVTSVSPRGVIYSRRMVRDYDKYLKHKANGQKGGSPYIPKGVNPQIPDTRTKTPERKNPPTPQGGRRRTIPIPPDFQPSAERMLVAKNLDLDAYETFRRFRMWAEESAYQSGDWEKRWVMWCEEEKRRNRHKRKAGVPIGLRPDGMANFDD